MTNLVRISELFTLKSGHSLEFNKQEKDPVNGINFVSRTAKNNGVVGKVLLSEKSGIVPEPGPVITVALGGSVLSTFLHLEPVVTGYHIQLLLPKSVMSHEELLFYCTAIEANKWKYSFGRQANKTLKDLLIPEFMPEEWKGRLREAKEKISDAAKPMQPLRTSPSALSFLEWGRFKLSDLFEMEKGDYKIAKSNQESGVIPLITASANDNGITNYVTLHNGQGVLHAGNKLTIAQNGSVGATFYQRVPFVANPDVAILTPKFQSANPKHLLFLATVIEHQASSRFHYGFKLNNKRLQDLTIYLPARSSMEGKYVPDWQKIETIVEGLNWSKSIYC